MTTIVVHEIAGDRLFDLFPDLFREACGRALRDARNETWVKAGCGYFCADCVRDGTHLTHPSACRT